jgi:hypothetical protein
MYNRIFNKKVTEAVERQSYDSLFKNWRGVMIGNGEIWFTTASPVENDPTKDIIYIIGINN